MSYVPGCGTKQEQEQAAEMRRLTEACRTYDGFRAELAKAHAAERAALAAEQEIERRLAAAWFASHPEELRGI